MNVGGQKKKCYLTIVTFCVKPWKFRVHFPNSSRFCSRFGTLQSYLLCCFTGGQCKGRWDSGAPGHQVQRQVHWWQSCSSGQLRAATISGTTGNGLWSRNCPCFFGLYSGKCRSKKRGKTLKQKLEPDGNVIRCSSPLGHQFKSSLFSSDQKSFPHGPREMHGEHRGCCIQTDKIVWR